MQVEELLRNGHKTTKLQLNGSLKEIENQISKLIESIVVNGATPIQFNQFPINAENNIIIKLIIFHRQCECFIYDLLNTLTECNIDRYLKRFRNQLNEIHEIVKFRTAIPISNIFVSSFVFYIIILQQILKILFLFWCIFALLFTFIKN